ncbi:MAG: DUF4166 domain-containing protein [Pseudomonadota bacterium]
MLRPRETSIRETDIRETHIHIDPAARNEPINDLQQDHRFQRLLTAEDWAGLPIAVQRRFSTKARNGASILYRGVTTRLRCTALGVLLANAARIIGAPLPLDRAGEGRAAMVAVTEDPCSDGQIWTRIYGRDSGFPQMINSVKRFTGETGLEENVGGGVCMSLALSVEDGALAFSSVDYFCSVFGRRLRVPRWMRPGDMRIVHRDRGDGGFAFELTLRHPLLGVLVEQTTIFHDMEEARHDH